MKSLRVVLCAIAALCWGAAAHAQDKASSYSPRPYYLTDAAPGGCNGDSTHDLALIALASARAGPNAVIIGPAGMSCSWQGAILSQPGQTFWAEAGFTLTAKATGADSTLFKIQAPGVHIHCERWATLDGNRTFVAGQGGTSSGVEINAANGAPASSGVDGCTLQNFNGNGVNEAITNYSIAANVLTLALTPVTHNPLTVGPNILLSKLGGNLPPWLDGTKLPAASVGGGATSLTMNLPPNGSSSASIVGTTLTLGGTLTGHPGVGQLVEGAGVTPTYITDGAGISWTVDVSQNVGPVAMTYGANAPTTAVSGAVATTGVPGSAGNGVRVIGAPQNVSIHDNRILNTGGEGVHEDNVGVGALVDGFQFYNNFIDRSGETIQFAAEYLIQNKLDPRYFLRSPLVYGNIARGPPNFVDAANPACIFNGAVDANPDPGVCSAAHYAFSWSYLYNSAVGRFVCDGYGHSCVELARNFNTTVAGVVANAGPELAQAGQDCVQADGGNSGLSIGPVSCNGMLTANVVVTSSPQPVLTWTIAGNIATFVTPGGYGFGVGLTVNLSGFTVGTMFNGVTAPVTAVTSNSLSINCASLACSHGDVSTPQTEGASAQALTLNLDINIGAVTGNAIGPNRASIFLQNVHHFTIGCGGSFNGGSFQNTDLVQLKDSDHGSICAGVVRGADDVLKISGSVSETLDSINVYGLAASNMNTTGPINTAGLSPATLGANNTWCGGTFAAATLNCRSSGGAFALFSGAALPVSTGAGTGTQDLNTYSLAAGALDLVGRQLEIKACFRHANNTDSTTNKIFFGSQVVSIIVATALQPSCLTADVVKTGPSTQDILFTTYSDGGKMNLTSVSGTETDTSAITIKASAADAVSAAGDSVLTNFSVKFLN